MGFFDSFSNAFGNSAGDGSFAPSSSGLAAGKSNPLTLVRKYASTAETYLKKADREYAYYKNKANGDPQMHYLKAQQSYAKALEIAELGIRAMRENSIADSSLSERFEAVIAKCKRI